MSVAPESDFHPDFHQSVPQSKGIPSFLPVLAAFTLICIFAIGAGVVFSSGYGHMWPSEHTMRMPLGDMHK